MIHFWKQRYLIALKSQWTLSDVPRWQANLKWKLLFTSKIKIKFQNNKRRTIIKALVSNVCNWSILLSRNFTLTWSNNFSFYLIKTIVFRYISSYKTILDIILSVMNNILKTSYVSKLNRDYSWMKLIKINFKHE